jgi:hypothetical protein
MTIVARTYGFVPGSEESGVSERPIDAWHRGYASAAETADNVLAEEFLYREIPSGAFPVGDESDEWHAGYDAAIRDARRRLNGTDL